MTFSQVMKWGRSKMDDKEIELQVTENLPKAIEAAKRFTDNFTTGVLQRILRINYSVAKGIIDRMEQMGIVSPINKEYKRAVNHEVIAKYELGANRMEILAGNMDNYFSRTGIKAKKTWDGTRYGGGTYQVWELSQEEFEKLDATSEESYQSGEWWRSAEGSNMGKADVLYIINGKEIKAWDGAHREDFDEEEEELFEREYSRLTEYFCDEVGASLEKNVCALAVDLAKQNRMTMAELFAKYEPKPYYLCDCCHNTDNPIDDDISICKKCGKQICNACVINLKAGEEIPCDDQERINSKYCPFCGREGAKQ
jgi:ribosomal protein S25